MVLRPLSISGFVLRVVILVSVTTIGSFIVMGSWVFTKAGMFILGAVLASAIILGAIEQIWLKTKARKRR
jgi:hypothetical protein